MNFIKKNLSSIVACLIETIVGILLLVNPVGFTSGIIVVIGILLLAGGFAEVVRYFRAETAVAVIGKNLARGLLYMIAGFFCIFNYDWFIMTFPVLTILYGVANLIAGLFKVQFTVDAIRLKARWGWAAISALVTLVFAAVIILNPFSSTVALWMFIGITLIVEAVIDLVSIIISGRKTVHAN